MKENALVSVIVPVYKVEEYLSRCIESIINQTYKNLEIILVDDGSPDNCPQICDEYAKKDNRIKVIHKENGGLSDARNAGMKIATGEYTAFIDSDDYIDLSMFEHMVQVSIVEKADIVECNVYSVYDNCIEKYNTDTYAIYNQNNLIMEAYIKYYHIKTVVWNKLYKTELIKNISFEFGKYNEDEFFTYRVLANANVLVHIDNYYYYYYQRVGSIMGSEYSIKALDSLEGSMQRAVFIKNNYPELYFYQLKTITFLCIDQYQRLLLNKNTDGYKFGKDKVKKYRKMLKWTIADLKRLDFKKAFFVILSSISMDICAKLRIFLGLGSVK